MLTLILTSIVLSGVALIVSLFSIIAYPSKDEREEEIQRIFREEELKKVADLKRRYR